MSDDDTRRRGARSVRSLLAESTGGLAELVAAAGRLEQVDAALAEVLDPAVRAHVRAIGLDGGILTLLADSPAWATRLRFLAPMLREELAGVGPLERVAIVARPVSPERVLEPPVRQAASLSEETATLLESIADGIADSALSESVRRVARHRRP